MEGSIKKRGTTWYLIYEAPRTADGHRRRKWERTDAKTKADAQRALRQRLSEIENGGYVEVTRLSLGEFLDRWLKDYAGPRIRPAAFKDYESAMRLHVKPTLGEKVLAKLTPMDIQRLYGQLLESGVSAHRVFRVHRVLRQALSHAVRWQAVARNVADAVSPPKPGRREMSTLDPEQARRLMETVRGTELEGPVSLAVYTGLRRSEVLGLRWKDTDLQTAALQVVQSLQRTPDGLTVLPPKTARSRRRVALSPQAVALLRKHHARQAEHRLAAGPAWEDGDWLFTRADGRPMSPDALSHQFAQVARGLGLPGTGLHMLRHSHASLLLTQGIHPKIVSERLGHSTVSITLDTYSHVLPGLQEAAAVAFDQALAVGAGTPVANR